MSSNREEIPSLTNPPNASKKRRQRKPLQHLFEEEERKPEWRVLAESGWVRSKFLRYTPEDKLKIEDYDILITLRELYFPTSQPLNVFELSYCELLRGVIDGKLYVL